MKAWVPLTGDSNTAAAAAEHQGSGDNNCRYRNTIHLTCQLHLPAHHRTSTNQRGQHVTRESAALLIVSLPTHEETTRSRACFNLAPTPGRSCTGDRQVSHSLAQLEAGWQGGLRFYFGSPPHLEPSGQSLTSNGNREELSLGSTHSNTGRTDRDRPHLLNDLIPPIDIRPNLPLTSSAYRMGLPELITSSEVLVIKGQSKSARGANKEAIVSLEASWG